MELLFKILRQSFRMIRSYRLYSVVNIIGLALALACVTIISKYVWREMYTDHFHKDLDRIYYTTSRGGLDRFEYVRFFEDRNNCIDIDINEQPEIEVFTSVIPMKNEEITTDRLKVNADILVVDSNFYRVFNFPLPVGDKQTILSDPTHAIITRRFARKTFGDGDPLGKAFSLFDKTLTVAGIAEEVPYNTSFEYDVIVPVHMQSEWSYGRAGYFKMYPGSDIAALNKRIGIPLKFYSDDDNPSVFCFRPFKNYYLGSPEIKSSGMSYMKQGNAGNLRMLTAIAFVILLIGIFNFVNIYTVTLLRRGKELGVKKVFGVGSGTMIRQFICENLILVGMAALLALGLIVVLQPYIGTKLDIPIVFNARFDIPFGIAVLLLLPLLTSLYPYIRYRYNPPVATLRDVRGRIGSENGRAVFMVMQYVMTVALILISAFFIRQLHFMLDSDLGYNKDHIVKTTFIKHKRYIQRFQNDDEWKTEREKEDRRTAMVLNELNGMPFIKRWSATDSPNTVAPGDLTFTRQDDPDSPVVCAHTEADRAAFAMYGYELLQGRSFCDSIDTFESNNVMLNETARKALGVEIGDVIVSSRSLWWSYNHADPGNYTVIGFIKDFAFQHLSKAIVPLVLKNDVNGGYIEDREISVEIVPGKEAETLEFLGDLYRKVNDGGEFTYSFVSDEVEAAYREDKKLTNVYGVFAVIAILISSLGLFSLSVYDVQQRYREIAIRKVNGATVASVMRMLSVRYYRLLSIAYVIAVPIAVFLIRNYMKDFAFKASLAWWIFVLAAAVTALVSLGTLWRQSWKAATENPAKAVKSE